MNDERDNLFERVHPNDEDELWHNMIRGISPTPYTATHVIEEARRRAEQQRQQGQEIEPYLRPFARVEPDLEPFPQFNITPMPGDMQYNRTQEHTNQIKIHFDSDVNGRHVRQELVFPEELVKGCEGATNIMLQMLDEKLQYILERSGVYDREG
jgi:hypothetical protein